MKIIEPSFEILTPFDREDAMLMLKRIERAARVCYKSEGKTTDTSAPEFVRRIANTFKHESVIEHEIVSVLIVCDRGVSHELVRHRLCAFSQESTRYCNYGKSDEITVIMPFFFKNDAQRYASWNCACTKAEWEYLDLLKRGASPQEARSVLPNSLKTEIVMTANLREWRHIFKLRTSDKAHPQMREVMIPILNYFSEVMPELFGSSEPASDALAIADVKAELEVYKQCVSNTNKACEFMREDTELDLTIGDRFSVEGVKKLRDSRDLWKMRAIQNEGQYEAAEKEVGILKAQIKELYNQRNQLLEKLKA